MTEPAMAARRLLEDPPSPRRRVMRGFLRHKGGIAGLAIFVAIVLTVLFGPLVHTVDPQWLDMTARNQGRSLAHPFGTDNLGRDTLAQLMAGGRISLAVGFAAMLISLAFGTLVGLLAGYFRALDGLLMRFTDLALALPLLPLLLVAIMLFRDSLRAIAGPELGVFVLIVTVIGITSWMQVARIVRTLHTTGINHRDLYLCHFEMDRHALLDARSAPGKLCLMDLHRAQLRPRVPHRWLVKDLAALLFSSLDAPLTQRDLLRFVRMYRQAPLRASLEADARLWRQVWQRAMRLYRSHWDRTPSAPAYNAAGYDK